MNTCETYLNRYHRLNSSAEAGCTVFFGADCFAGIPVGELAHSLNLDAPVYNRSVEGLSVYAAEKALNECVYQLKPGRVFVNLGENDLSASDFDIERFLSAYEWLLYTLNSHCRGKAQIYVVSILSLHPMTALVNERLKKLSADTGCIYVDISRASVCDERELRIFEIVRHHLRNHPIHIAEAFQLASM